MGLIGDVSYFKRGRRLASYDTDVSPEYAESVSRRQKPDATGAVSVVCWECRNGDPRDVRYYLRGRLLSDDEARRALTRPDEGDDEVQA